MSVFPSSCLERKQGLSVFVDEILNNEQIIISEQNYRKEIYS